MRKWIVTIGLFTAFSGLYAASHPDVVEYQKRQFGKEEPWSQPLKGHTQLVSDLSRLSKSEIKLSSYGGLKSKKVKATGFFYTKKMNDRWWFIDPEGYPYVMMGVVAMAPYDKRFEKKDLGPYKNENEWAEKTTKKFKELGFNCSGPWSFDEELQRQKNPLNYTKSIYLMYAFYSTYYSKRVGVHNMSFSNDVMPILDPRFEEFAMGWAKKTIRNEWVADSRLIGYFIDNELPWRKDSLQRFLELDQDDINYQKALEWLAEEKGVSLSRVKKAGSGKVSKSDSEKFLAYISDRYYSIAKKALKAADPNHLYLGSRIHSPYTKSKVLFTSMGKYVDVVSVNYYHKWAPETKDLNNWENWTDKPSIISEWYAKGEDSHCDNTSGAGLLVSNQAERGYFYQTFTLGLIDNGNCIGWHWYKYKDSPTEGKDSNRGFLSTSFDDYLPLQNSAKEVNCNTYKIIKLLDR